MSLRYRRLMSSYKKPVAGGGWWDLDGTITSCVAAYQPKGAASYAASLVDLTGNGYTATEAAGSPGWDASYGWGGDYTNYLVTGINPESVNDTWTGIVRYTELPNASGQYLFGKQSYINSASRYWGILRHWNNRRWALGTTSYTNNTNLAAGTCALAGALAYRDGTHLGTIEDYGEYFIDTEVPMLRCSAKIQAIAFYNAVLTSDQVSALTTAMNAL